HLPPRKSCIGKVCLAKGVVHHEYQSRFQDASLHPFLPCLDEGGHACHRLEHVVLGLCYLRFGEFAVQTQNCVLGSISSVGFLVRLADKGEGVEDVSGVGFTDAVQVEEGGIHLGSQEQATFLVPGERITFVSAVTGK